MRFCAQAALVASALLATLPVAAQEASTPDIGRDSILLRSRVGTEVAAAHFSLDKGSGQYIVVTALADITVRGWLSLRAVVPLDMLSLDGSAPRTRVGDVVGRMKFKLFETTDWLVQASVTAQFPTGDASHGMGNGAPALTPLITAGYEIGRAILYLTLSDSFSLRPHGPAPENFIDPSTDQEIVAIAGANVRLAHGAFVQLTVTPIFPLLAPDRAHPFLYTTPVIGVSSSVLRVGFGMQIPIAGAFRFDERAVASALFFLP
jgi:hypothetical protein